MENATQGYGPRTSNQGELLNFQNLGRSYFAKKAYQVGDIIKKEDLVYASPAVGLVASDIGVFDKKATRRPIAKGSVLVRSMFEEQVVINNKQREFCRQKSIALPVRIHDKADIVSVFDVGNYEFHLSYAEVDGGLHDVPISTQDRYSIHLPDYVGPLHLIDPFDVGDVGDHSSKILDRVSDFAKRIEDITGKICPIVGSFSVLGELSKREFYENISKLCDKFDRNSLKLLPQWLPPIAWYFGGSVELRVFNSSVDVQYLNEFDLEICFDSSHFLMCHHTGNVNSELDLGILLERAGHIHLSGADGIDGEGTSLVNLDDFTYRVIQKCISKDCMKVIETWQGHLDNYDGFHSTIISLTELDRN
jgi:N-acetylneuraminate synthase